MPKITHFDIGDLWTPQATWMVDSNGDGVPETPTDPSQIIVRQKTPAGAESVVTTAGAPSALTSASTPLARMSQGVFKLNPGITLNDLGPWYVRFEGTGSAEASEEYQAIVDPSQFGGDSGVSSRALVTLDEAKNHLRKLNVDTSDDLELVRVINDMSERFHDEAGREFKPFVTNPSTRTFAVSQDAVSCGKIYVGDLASLSTGSPVSIVSGLDWTTVIQSVATANIGLWPYVRKPWQPATALEFNVNVIPFSFGQRLTVAGNWGFPSVPGNVRQAMLDAVASAYDVDVEHWRQDLQPTPTSPEAGTVIVQQFSAQRILALPPAAQVVAWSYREPSLS